MGLLDEHEQCVNKAGAPLVLNCPGLLHEQFLSWSQAGCKQTLFTGACWLSEQVHPLGTLAGAPAEMYETTDDDKLRLGPSCC